MTKKHFNSSKLIRFHLNTSFSYDYIDVKLFSLNQLSILTGFSRTGIIKMVERAKNSLETMITIFHKGDKLKRYPYKLKFVYVDGKLMFVKCIQSTECVHENEPLKFTEIYN